MKIIPLICMVQWTTMNMHGNILTPLFQNSEDSRRGDPNLSNTETAQKVLTVQETSVDVSW